MSEKKKSKPSSGKIRPERAALDTLRGTLDGLRGLFPSLTKPAAKKTREELEKLVETIAAAQADLDPIKDPGASFDPGNPDTAGHLVALGLLAQDKVPLGSIARTYGSGVYAIYYEGEHPAYVRLSKTETPIYVGKADPKRPDARTPREQGPQLYGRLADHRRMIMTVQKHAEENGLENPLDIADFKCRRLVCATNAQLAAETHLINMFKPIWNEDFKICWGISKHGDAATTRKNKRSPWDVLHPGRTWAMSEILEDKMAPENIVDAITAHLDLHPPFEDRQVIIDTFLAAFKQDAAAAPGEPQEDDIDDAIIAEIEADDENQKVE